MASSAARKLRLKRVREHKLNPEFQRRNWHGVNPVQKVTPSLTEKANKLNNKHKKKWSPSQDNTDGSFFYEITENTCDFNHEMNRLVLNLIVSTDARKNLSFFCVPFPLEQTFGILSVIAKRTIPGTKIDSL